MLFGLIIIPSDRRPALRGSAPALSPLAAQAPLAISIPKMRPAYLSQTSSAARLRAPVLLAISAEKLHVSAKLFAAADASAPRSKAFATPPKTSPLQPWRDKIAPGPCQTRLAVHVSRPRATIRSASPRSGARRHGDPHRFIQSPELICMFKKTSSRALAAGLARPSRSARLAFSPPCPAVGQSARHSQRPANHRMKI